MISGKDFILISGIEWDSLWQGSHEIATRLAQAGNRVLYVENLGVRAPTWKDKTRVVRRLKSWASSLGDRGVRQVAPNLFVCTPILLPPFGSRWQRSLNRKLLWFVWLVARYLGMRDPIVWDFLPTDTALDLVNLFRSHYSTRVIYHCTADFSELIPSRSQLARHERSLLLTSDLVFATCRQLAETCAAVNKNVHVFSNGVDFAKFKTNGFNGHESYPFAGEQRPIIGYVGGLHRFVDFDLVLQMARLRPDWSWIFVGPTQSHVGDLAELPNVHLLGLQPHDQLAGLIHGFDVCVVPYLNNKATSTIVPTKINEYLAVGKPVVTTKLPTIVDFNSKHQVLLTAESTSTDFLAALERALQTRNDKLLTERRIQTARLNDWKVLIESMSDLIQKEIQIGP